MVFTATGERFNAGIKFFVIIKNTEIICKNFLGNGLYLEFRLALLAKRTLCRCGEKVTLLRQGRRVMSPGAGSIGVVSSARKASTGCSLALSGVASVACPAAESTKTGETGLGLIYLRTSIVVRADCTASIIIFALI
uniref:Uncharacterized protein n=1 Tax=Oryza sativa subsp. japonica TaxID=39947 RepID=Q69KE1_ORYSJ|nr:hypothetical protein [Oryza sativa Japonica Group]